MIEFLAGAFTTGMILLAVLVRHLENDIRHTRTGIDLIRQTMESEARL
jgi:hypothetical protein